MNTNDLRSQAERDAQKLLTDLSLTDLWDMPIDVTRVAEGWGAEVYLDDLDDEDLDGFVLIGPSGTEITINRTRALNRRRFTCAHELGHAVQHRSELDKKKSIGFVDNDETLDEQVTKKFRDYASQQGVVPDEIYANAFAAALLMPKHLVEVLDRAGQNAGQMARFFRVSTTAMQYRLENLGLR